MSISSDFDKENRIYQPQPIPPRKDKQLSPFRLRKQSKRTSARSLLYYDLQLGMNLERKSRQFLADAGRYADVESNDIYEGEFKAYYTTYSDMTKDVLRGYFGFRSRIRRGEYSDAPLSFKFLLVYEILSNIGVASAADGFALLEKIKANYAEPALQRYLELWMRDYCLYYGLEGQYMYEAFAKRREADKFREILWSPSDYNCSEIFEAMKQFSSYDIEHSSFMKAYPEECSEAMARIYIRLCSEYEKKGDSKFREMFCGIRGRYPYRIFRNAVFADKKIHPDCSYEIDSVRRYFCKGGEWYCEAFGENDLKKQRSMGKLMHESDRILREVFDFRKRLRPDTINERAEKIIKEVLLKLLAERKRSRRKVININTALLSGIRTDAEATQSSLLSGIEEYEEYISDKYSETPAAEDVINTVIEADAKLSDGGEGNSAQENLALSPAEADFLRLLLKGEDWQGYLADKKIMPTLLAESINEKLMDVIGDTVLEETADNEYIIVEDYRDELTGALMKH